MDVEKFTNQELLEFFKNKNDIEKATHAFNAFYKRHAQLLYSVICELKFSRNGICIGNEKVAADLLSDVFTKVWLNNLPESFKDVNDNNKVAWYLFKIALNCFKDDKDNIYFDPKHKIKLYIQKKTEAENRQKEFKKFSDKNLTREETKSSLYLLREFIEELSTMDQDILLTHLIYYPMDGQKLPKDEMERLKINYDLSSNYINKLYHRTVDKANKLLTFR